MFANIYNWISVEQWTILGRIIETPGQNTKYYGDDPDTYKWWHINADGKREYVDINDLPDSYPALSEYHRQYFIGAGWHVKHPESKAPVYRVGNIYAVVKSLKNEGLISATKVGSSSYLEPTAIGRSLYEQWANFASNVETQLRAAGIYLHDAEARYRNYGANN